MSLSEPRRQSQDLITTAPEPQYRASQEYVVRAFRPSTMTANTFTDVAMTTVAVGLYVVPEDGDARGQVRQIKSVTGLVATVDAAWTSSTGVSSIRAWMPADVPVRVTTADGSSLFDAISSLHAGVANEPDSFYSSKGYALLWVGGANAGAARAITTFTTAAGTFADGSPGATSIGDLALIRKVLRPEADVSAEVTAKTLARRIIGTGNLDADAPVPITADGKISFDLAQRPITASAGSGVAATAPVEIGDLLADMMTQRLDTGGTITAVGATLSTSASVWTAGSFVLAPSGEVAQIMAAPSTDITSYGTGQLTTSAITTGVAYASASYIRKTLDFRTRTFDLWRGGKLRQIMHGCMASLKIAIDREQVVKFQFAYMSGDVIEYNVDRPVAIGATNAIPIPDFGVPFDGKGARCLIDGTRVHVSALSVDLGYTPKMRTSLGGMNQYDGCMMDAGPVTGAMTIHADVDDISGFRGLADRIRSGKLQQLLYQKGSAPKSTWAMGIPACYFSQTNFKYNDRQGQFEVQFQAVNPESAGYSIASFPGLPAISFGWL